LGINNSRCNVANKKIEMKILNLYACLGGNRYKWNEVKEDIEVTAIELDPELARLYQERFPNDTVIIADAHKYLLEHYQEYDFIWSSPPCPSHSRARFWNSKAKRVYPDLKLYEEIILLQTHFKGKYCVENVVPYYEPLIPAIKRGRHLFWTNFNLPIVLSDRSLKIVQKGKEMERLIKFHDYNFRKYKGEQFIYKIGRNLVDYEAGKNILDTAIGIVSKKEDNQTELF
jgi:DNA (cytosine-5)-methyltransferase 1